MSGPSEMQHWYQDLETLPPDELKRRQEKMLSAQLAGLGQRSAYYGEVLSRVGGGQGWTLEDFAARVPTIDKIAILEDQKSFPPYGSLFSAKPEDLVRIYTQPGPEFIPWTRADMDAMVDAWAYALFTSGVRSDDVVDQTLQFNWVMGGTMYDDGARRLGAAAVPGGAGMKQMHIDALQRLGVSVLIGFPTFLKDIGITARESGIDTRDGTAVRLLMLSGEMPSPSMREELRELFGAELREVYGTSEVGLVASTCGHGEGMHVNPHMLVEVVDPATGQPVADGEPGEIILTDLRGKEALPVLRYRTHDLTMGLRREPCACGRTTVRLGKIIGRTGHVARVKGLFVFPGQFTDLVGGFPDLGRFQLVIDRPNVGDHLTLRVECARPGADLAVAVADKVKGATRLSVDVEFLAPGSLPADAPVLNDLRNTASA